MIDKQTKILTEREYRESVRQIQTMRKELNRLEEKISEVLKKYDNESEENDSTIN